MSNDSREKQLEADIRRTIILGAYLKHWGMPDSRITSSRQGEVVEVYSFPPMSEGGKVHRVASVGMSGVRRADGARVSYELLLTLPRDMGQVSFEEAASFLMDVFAYSLRADVSFAEGNVIPETPLMPKHWNPRAILIDEPRGEPEELSNFQVGGQDVHLLWVVPIYRSEYELILRDGLDDFDRRCEQSEWSLADPRRPPFV